MIAFYEHRWRHYGSGRHLNGDEKTPDTKTETRFHLSWSGKAKARLQSHVLTSDIALSSSILFTSCRLRSEKIGDDVDCERTKACFVVQLQQSWMKWEKEKLLLFFPFFSLLFLSIFNSCWVSIASSCVRLNIFSKLKTEKFHSCRKIQPKHNFNLWNSKAIVQLFLLDLSPN